MNEPKLRFKADDGKDFPVWKEQYLSDIASFHSGLTYAPDDVVNDGSGVLVLRSSNIQNGQICYDDNVYVNKELKEQDYVKLHDIVVCVRNGSKSLVGKNALVTESDLNATWGAFMTVIRAKHNYEFVHQYLNSALFKKEMYKDSGTTTINQITAAMLNDCKLSVPSLPEQQKIASLFSEIDTLIQSAEKELEGYRELKQGMLQKMFPKKGEKVPEIRFPEFTDDWEQRKLEQVAKYRNGKAHENEIDESGDYIVVNSKFVSTNGEVKKYSASQIEPLFENEIAFVLSDVPNGRAIARTFLVNESGKYTLNQRIAGITPLDKTYPYFLHIVMNRNPYFLKFDDGVKQTNLSLNDVLNFKEYYPEYDEQKKIGDYFANLDNLIILQQKELDGYKELKKGLLQQMFC